MTRPVSSSVILGTRSLGREAGEGADSGGAEMEAVEGWRFRLTVAETLLIIREISLGSRESDHPCKNNQYVGLVPGS